MLIIAYQFSVIRDQFSEVCSCACIPLERDEKIWSGFPLGNIGEIFTDVTPRCSVLVHECSIFLYESEVSNVNKDSVLPCLTPWDAGVL